MPQKYELLKHEFDPVYDSGSRILILGSFPSVKSREQKFYYGHPGNRFWKILAAVYRENVPISILEKKEMLTAHKIALWDVIAQCEIIGSSDASIRNVVPADLRMILEAAGIERICCNGSTAYRLFNRYQKESCGREAVCLPSSSPANAAWSLERLTEVWSKVL